MKLRQTFGLILITCFLGCSRKQENGSESEVQPATSRFQLGQVWTFHRPQNQWSNAALTVARVDFGPKEGPIVFISVTGAEHRIGELHNFMPLSEDALNRSVVALLTTNAPLTGKDSEDFEEFYEELRKEVQAGKAKKYFNKTVAELLEIERKGNY